MSNIVQYSGFSLDDLKEVDKKAEALSGSVFINMTEGDHILRILPPRTGNNPFRITALHYVDAVPGLDKMVVVACPRVELKEPCIVCAESARLSATRNPLDRERASRISASMRVYVNVIDRDNEEAGPRVLGIGKMIWEQLKAIRKNARLGGDFTDPTASGFDIIISRTGTGPRDTRYATNADRNNSPLAPTEALAKQWIEAQHDLEQFVDVTPPQELLQAWGALASVGRGAGAPPTIQADQPGARVMQAGRSAVQDAKKDPFDDE